MLRTDVCEGNEIDIDESKLDVRLTISISVKGTENKVLIKEGLLGRGNLALQTVLLKLKKFTSIKTWLLASSPLGGGVDVKL